MNASIILAGVKLLPRSFFCCASPCNPASDEAFRDVAGLEIKMTENRADISCRVKTRDRLAHRVENPLLSIVNRSSLSIGNDRPRFHGIEGWGTKRHHRFGRPTEILIRSSPTLAIPTGNRRFYSLRTDLYYS